MQLDLGTQSIIAGALYDFLGHLTTLDKNIVVGGRANPTPALDELCKWGAMRGLPMEDINIHIPVQDWDKAPEKPTLQMLASSGVGQHKRIIAALADFCQFSDSQTVTPNQRRNWGSLFKRWAVRKALTVSNPQVHWNFKQWL